MAANLDRRGGDELALLDRLDRRYGNEGKRPWLDRYSEFVGLAKGGSYICNIASALGLFYVVKVLFEVVPSPLVGDIAGFLVLGVFEYFKRKASDGFWDFYWVTRRIHWLKLSVNLGLFALSLAGTLWGIYFLITDNSPEAKYAGASDDPEAVAMLANVDQLRGQITDLQSQNEAARSNTANYNSKGEFYWKQQTQEEQRTKQITQVQGQITAIESQLASKHGIYEVRNEDILSAWQMRNDVRVKSGIGLCLLFELLFEICMGFLCLYDYKRFQLLQELEKRGRLNRGRAKSTLPKKQLNGHPMKV